MLAEYRLDQLVASSLDVILFTSAIAFVLLVSYLACSAIYNVYFHALRAFPGPKLAAASRIPYIRAQLGGRLSYFVKDLHDIYGDVVRIAPDELSFTDPLAWKDIYVHRQRHGNYSKDQAFYIPPVNGVHGLISAPDKDHSRMRRLVSHAFSEKALREMEPLIRSYVDLFIRNVREKVEASQGPVDLVRWYNWTTFDVIGDLTVGESFNCLKERDYHPWVSTIFEGIKGGVLLTASRRFPPIAKILGWFLPKSLMQKRLDHFRYTADRLARRLAMNVTRPDFVSYILRGTEEKGMSTAELQSNCSLFLIAGSETTATLLSGVTFYLLQNQRSLARLIEEIRDNFKTEAEMSSLEISKLPYLRAVLEEGLRMYPPVPVGLPRKVPAGGDYVSGHWIPGNTTVAVHQFAAYRSVKNFQHPYSFLPERWLDDDKNNINSDFASDKRQALQPFSLGGRNCIGKHLAYAELRLILARLLWNFDLELAGGTEQDSWADQKMYSFWQKTPLMVKLIPRVVEA
ncbi:MAG: hypothetical protein M1837_003337 [Sclerophora amabilis]|nr:MAG: hypothetical protein M1837_003337 [Sclerophora amabilis]